MSRQGPPNATKKRAELLRDAQDCIKILQSCLRCYYAGDVHMYKPMAGQLRILFCDTYKGKDNSLLGRLLPDVQLPAFKPMRWETCGGKMAMAMMSTAIHRTKRGVEDANIDLQEPRRAVGLQDWLNHELTCDPEANRVRDIVRMVADKDGGAHADSDSPGALVSMKRFTLEREKGKVLYIIALAKYAVEHVGPLLECRAPAEERAASPQLPQELFHVSEQRLNPGDLIRSGRWGRIVLSLGQKHPYFFREHLLEICRTETTKVPVSRLACTYALETLDAARKWAAEGIKIGEPEQYTYRVSPLDITAPRARLDMLWVTWIGERGATTDKVARWCSGYWSGRAAADLKPSAQPAWEWLFACPLRVEAMV